MHLQVPSLESLSSAARAFVEALGDRRIFAFYGPMGAGKTTFIAAICRELGVAEAVSSPTFAIVNEYQSATDSVLQGEPIYHFDFYRIRRLEEAYDIGFNDYLESGSLCLIEWPELIEDLLPEDVVEVHIDEDAATHERAITF
ncbi:MAG: tRNA (adenosine(37)-N6)-threonylcarbamoyltransferase complex ATPase subunit type 1 TsaE [Bacteroidaceae bacterium]|nr:tRNA (adenosine(37)-N6)-threonylcarbamoyltransferase complex ATPase subunit type 1 TsaE [Bacteroidaceae bacterium]